MRILVTGSTGQLGKVLVNHLQKFGHDVTGIDVTAAPTTDHLINVLQKEQINKISQNIDAVIHTAAVHGKHYDLNYSRDTFIDVNIKGTLNLLNACVINNVKHFLYVSTTSIYGTAMVSSNQAVWVDEQLAEQPRDIYDITKQTAEQLCKDFFYKEGLQTSVYRVARFLPENENLRANHRLYRGLDERDGAEALRLALSASFKNFEVFNISSGSPFQKEDLIALKHEPAKAINKYYPEAAEIYRLKNWVFPVSIDRVYVTEKARHLLNYEPTYTFKQLLHANNELLM
jgi:UDP-glucose 4-epimerase